MSGALNILEKEMLDLILQTDQLILLKDKALGIVRSKLLKLFAWGTLTSYLQISYFNNIALF